MGVVANIIDVFILSIISEKHNELQIYFDTLVSQVEKFQYDQIPASLVSTKQIPCIYPAFRLVCPHLCYIVLLWITRWLPQVLWPHGPPADLNQSHEVCACTHISRSIAQGSAPLQRNFPLPDVLIKPIAGKLTNDELSVGSPRHPLSPGQVSIRPVQGDDLNVDGAENPSTCFSCGLPTSEIQSSKPIRGGAKPAVQKKTSSVLPGDQAYATLQTRHAPLLSVLTCRPNNQPGPASELDNILNLEILVIAKSDQEGDRPLTGPEADTKYFHAKLGGLSNTFVESISDSEATLDRVDQAIGDIWKRAQEGSHLLILLTGHGIQNGMALANGGRIDERHIQKKVQELNVECLKNLRVIVIFDICRDGRPEDDPDREVGVMDLHTSLIWSCSLGQTAGSLEFKSFMPGSFFLIAFFKAYQDVCEKRGTFEERLKFRNKQLARYDSYRNHTSVVDGVPNCGVCIRDKVWCSQAFVIQKKFKRDIDTEQSQGDLNRLSSFLQQEKYDGTLPDRISDFFSKCDLFDERSKYSFQLFYLIQNRTDTQAWLGWLDWLSELLWPIRLVWLATLIWLDSWDWPIV